MESGEIERRFDRAAANYERHDALEREVGARLLQRVTHARRPPERIVDLGCGTGRATAALKDRFGEAGVTGLDISRGMLRGLEAASSEDEPLFAVRADLTHLPLSARSADLVYCNLALQWAGDFGHALDEIRRVLRPEGMLLFSVPGPDSLRELRGGSGQGGSESIPIYMPDLRDVGDLLVSAGYREIVMDSEMITLTYPNVEAMRRELAVTGGAGFAKLPEVGRDGEGVEISFEIVYGTAFGPPEGQPVRSGEGEVATFSVDQLRKE